MVENDFTGKEIFFCKSDPKKGVFRTKNTKNLIEIY